VETGAAAAGGVGRAEACDRRCNQSCCEKILHFLSFIGRDAAPLGALFDAITQASTELSES
jgi:hypothetical protein